MEFELPGQYRGPECRVLLPVTKRLKQELTPAFASLASNKIKKLSPILRVGGSLGSFGEDILDDVKILKKEAECDVIVAPRPWDTMSEDEIYAILRPRIIEASKAMLKVGGFIETPAFLAS